jgi:hypothetical protein
MGVLQRVEETTWRQKGRTKWANEIYFTTGTSCCWPGHLMEEKRNTCVGLQIVVGKYVGKVLLGKPRSRA